MWLYVKVLKLFSKERHPMENDNPKTEVVLMLNVGSDLLSVNDTHCTDFHLRLQLFVSHCDSQVDRRRKNSKFFFFNADLHKNLERYTSRLSNG